MVGTNKGRKGISRGDNSMVGIEREFSAESDVLQGYGVIDFRDIVIWVVGHKWLLILSFLVFGSLGAVFAFNLSNTYRAETLLIDADHNQGATTGPLSGSLGGLASFAGINLDNGRGKIAYALEVLKSRRFIYQFIVDHDIRQDLLLVKGWDEKANQLMFSRAGRNMVNRREWAKNNPIDDKVYGIEKAYQIFLSRLMVSYDDKSGFVRIGFEFFSPIYSKNIVDSLISDINADVRAADIADAEKNIQFLESQIEATNVIEMKMVFYQLIEEQVKTVMLSKSREEYVFKVIDPAIVQVQPHGPNRLLLILAAGFVGLIIVIVYSLLTNASKFY
ncbi:subunit length determinant protein [Alteromonadaceae bacterium 2753L.S.0a.02]|nr:subunit length determinant protein [Alteromonadaceae bacterium 2753L.S.0a.02]